MFDWLYKKAGKVKKIFYLAGGLGVAVTTVIGCVPKAATKTISWVANLVSLVFSGEIYSTLKNMEIAEKITQKQRRVREIKERLSLLKQPISIADIDYIFHKRCKSEVEIYKL